MKKIGEISLLDQARVVFGKVDGKIYTAIKTRGGVYFFKRDKIDGEISMSHQEHLVDISEYTLII